METGRSFRIIQADKNTAIRIKIPILSPSTVYTGKDLRLDLVSGLTVGSILIPQAMAYAKLAGMPPIYGLYTGLVPLIVYALFASSKKLSIGPVAISALLVFSGISQIAEVGSEEYIQYVILTGLCIGIVQIVLSFLKLGFLVNFLSHPVIVGFTAAASIIIIITQLDEVFGVAIPASKNLLSPILYLFENYNLIHLGSTVIAFGTLALILILKKIHKAIPGPLLVVIGGIALSYFLDFASMNISIIGNIPKGLPAFIFPVVDETSLKLIFPTVITVSIIGIVECIGIAKSLEAKHKDHILNADKELFALGISKVFGSFFQSIPSSGSFSRSAINSELGSKTQLTSIFAALLVALAVLFLTDLFYYLPDAVLAAIILIAVSGLMDFKEAKYLWHSHRKDFVMMLITFLATLIFGIKEGVLFGVSLSILMVLYKSSKPPLVLLGNIPGTRYFKNIERYDEALSIQNTLIIRFDNQLYFGNSSFFKERIYRMVEQYPGKLKYVILDGSKIHDIDSTGAHALKDLDNSLKKKNIELHMCGAIGPVRDRLSKSGLLREPDKHHMQVFDAVELITNKKENSSDFICRPGDPMQTNVD